MNGEAMRRVLAGLAAVLAAGATRAAEIWVDGAWEGEQLGSEAAPFSAITAGLDALAASNAVAPGGHALMVKTGAYTNGLQVTAAHNGLATATNEVRAAGAVTLSRRGVGFSAATNVALRGFTIRDVKSTAALRDHGVAVTNYSRAIEVADCRILDCGDDIYDYGVYNYFPQYLPGTTIGSGNGDFVVRRCVVAGNFSSGVYFGGYARNGNVLDRCVIYGNNGQGIFQSMLSYIRVTDSILAGNGSNGAIEGHNQGGIELVNCLLYGNGLANYYLYDNLPVWESKACDTAADINAHYDSSYGFVVSNRNNRVGNPGFVMIGPEWDFARVYADSPALGGASDAGDIGWTNTLAQVALGSSTYHVSGTAGDDGNDGSAQNPWQTIGRAAAVAKAGDTVVVAAGTYQESVVITNGGSETASVVYRADGAVKLDGANYTLPFGLRCLRVANVVLDGFEVTGFAQYMVPMVDIDGAAYCVLTNLHIHHSKTGYGYGHGLRFKTSQRCALASSRMENHQYYGVTTAGKSGGLTLDRCLMANGQYGFSLNDSPNPRIRSCVFTNLTTAAVYLYNGDTTAWIDNCTFVNVYRALSLSIDPSNIAVLRNCIASGVTRVGEEGHTQGNIQFFTNCFWNVGASLLVDYDGAGTITDIETLNAHADAEGNFIADPEFKAAAAGDFRLAGGSPCIDAGALITDVGARDYYGGSRLVGRVLDLGAAESQVRLATVLLVR